METDMWKPFRVEKKWKSRREETEERHTRISTDCLYCEKADLSFRAQEPFRNLSVCFVVIS